MLIPTFKITVQLRLFLILSLVSINAFSQHFSGEFVFKIDSINCEVLFLNQSDKLLQAVKDAPYYRVSPTSGIIKIHFNNCQDDYIYNELIVSTDTLIPGRIYPIRPEKRSNSLDEIQIRIKNRFYLEDDTLKLQIGEVKTAPHATSKDLLERINGISISSNGQLWVYGKQINKVRVNGKMINNGNPILTLEALNKEMIDELLIGNFSDQNSKILDIKIKEDHSKGIYGSIERKPKKLFGNC